MSLLFKFFVHILSVNDEKGERLHRIRLLLATLNIVFHVKCERGSMRVKVSVSGSIFAMRNCFLKSISVGCPSFPMVAAIPKYLPSSCSVVIFNNLEYGELLTKK